jgi:chemotaxis protein MotB
MNPRTSRGRVGHDRWLVSYADFITLLFAFFVVLYAFARADQKRQMQVSEAIDSAFRSMGAFSTTQQPASKQNASSGVTSQDVENSVITENLLVPAEVLEGLDRLRHNLTQVLSSQIASHAISLEMGRDGLVISLREAGFFDSGSATPKPEALSTLQRIATELGATPYDLRVEGHTDNVPIHNAEFDSNWELSSARATHIARLFLEMKTIPPERISAAGYAEYHPVATNNTAEGRAENRRVDLVVMPGTKLNFAAQNDAQSPGAWRKISDGD